MSKRKAESDRKREFNEQWGNKIVIEKIEKIVVIYSGSVRKTVVHCVSVMGNRKYKAFLKRKMSYRRKEAFYVITTGHFIWHF